MVFELLDDSPASVRLLVQDHCVQACAFDYPRNFRFCGAIATMNDEHIPGVLAGRRLGGIDGCIRYHRLDLRP